MNEYNKELAIILVICLVGCYGTFFDYLLGERLLIPFTLWEINEIPEFAVLEEKEKVKVSSAWFLIMLFGIMLSVIRIGRFKSKYKGKELIKYLVNNYGRRKIREGIYLHSEWRRRKNERINIKTNKRNVNNKNI